MASFYRQQLEEYLKKLDVTADLLYDIGGAQKSAKGRTKSWNVKELVCLDLPAYDLNEPQTHDRKADFVLCLEVFEYLIDPLQAVKNIADALKKGGTAVVSFPFVYPVHNEVEFDSLRYTLSGIKRFAQKAGLGIADVHYRRAKTATLVKYYQEDGMKMAKGHEHGITGYIVRFKK